MIPTNRKPTHPGEMLLEEFLEPLGMTQVAAAKKMGISLNRLNEIIHSKRSVTAETAIHLAQLLGTSPTFWMNLQAAWDMYHAAKRLHVDLDAVGAAPTSAEASGDVAPGPHERVTTLGTSWFDAMQQVILPDSEQIATGTKTSLAADNQYCLAA